MVTIFLVSVTSLLAQVTQTLYINSGLYTAVDSAQFDFCAFNATPVFNPVSERITVQSGSSLDITVINTDSVSHGFSIKGKTAAVSIAPGDTAVVSTSFSQAMQAFVYYDPTLFPGMAALGLGGMIYVHDGSVTATFFWDIKEFRKDWAALHRQQMPVAWDEYYPDYFTINGKSNPDINSDPSARVTGNVGQTIRIVMSNTGQSTHSMHFHGYHSTIIYSSKWPEHVGRIKDTFPILSMETLILELVPDKPGEYPVHDHNALAVTGGGVYPFGMFLTILVQ